MAIGGAHAGEPEGVHGRGLGEVRAWAAHVGEVGELVGEEEEPFLFWGVGAHVSLDDGAITLLPLPPGPLS